MSHQYRITSTYNEEPVGLMPRNSLTKRQMTVPVVLGGKIIDFHSDSDNLLEDSPVKLGIGKFPCTFEKYGDVVATDDSNECQEWYLIPHDKEKQLCYIAMGLPNTSNPRPEVWNAEYNEGPIRLEPLSKGRPQQIFRIMRIMPRK